MKNYLGTLLIMSLIICSNTTFSKAQNTTKEIQQTIDSALSGEVITIDAGTYEGLLKITNKSKLKIIFENVTIKTFFDETILIIENSSDISIEGLTLFHEVGKDKCFTNCIDVNYSNNIIINKFDISGSGYIGICINQSDIIVKNSKIYDCGYLGIFLWDGNDHTELKEVSYSGVVVKNCNFTDNKSGNIGFYPQYVEADSSGGTILCVEIDEKSTCVGKDNYEDFLQGYEYIID